MKRIFAALLLCAAFAAPHARAVTICDQCEYGDSAATYLGVLNAATADIATFFNDGIGDSLFVNFWVFDVGPVGGRGIAAASFVVETFIRLFRGQLFHDDGSQCAPGIGCTSVELGDFIDEDFAVNRAIAIPFDLEPGRYVLRISGGTVPPREGGYNGIISFFPIPISEAGTFWLVSVGLLLMLVGAAVAKYRRP